MDPGQQTGACGSASNPLRPSIQFARKSSMPSLSGCGSPSSTRIEAIPASALQPSPWKNGGGITREIHVYPAGAGPESFAWRISAADVTQAGPFSSYRNIDRTIVLTHGGSMLLLDGAGRTHHRLKRWEPHQFSGETTIRAELPDGPTRDFNLMVRRGAGTGRLTVQTAPQTLILEPDRKSTRLNSSH